jgi:hypothetical protein
LVRRDEWMMRLQHCPFRSQRRRQGTEVDVKQRPGAWALAAALAAAALCGWFLLRESAAPAAPSDLGRAEEEERLARQPLEAQLPREARSAAESLGAEASGESASRSPLEAAAVAAAADDYRIEVLDSAGRHLRDLKVRTRIELLGIEIDRYRYGVDRAFAAPPATPEIRVPSVEIREELRRGAELVRSTPAARGFRLCFALRDSLLPCVSRLVTGAEDEDRRIAIQLEPMSRVRIEAYDAAGRSLQRPLLYVLRIPTTQRFSTVARLSAESSSGSHVFPWVPPARDLEARLEDPTGQWLEALQRIETPAAGEELVVQLRLEREAPSLSGRLIDPRGKPASDQSFAFAAHRQGMQANLRASTDAEGRFTIYLGSHFRELGQPDTLSFKLVDRQDEDDLLPELRMLAPQLPESGRLDLGDLRFAQSTERKLLASGIVVDTEGQPLAHTRLHLWDVWPPRQTGPWDDSRPLSAGFGTDESGRFEIRSREQVRALRIAPALNGYYAVNPLTVEPGSKDLRLVMGRAFRMSGTILLPEKASSLAWQVHAQLEGQSSRKIDRVQTDGSFRIEGLKPGSTTVELWLDDALFHSVPAVQVGTAPEARDPRLDPLDLRTALRSWDLRLEDDAGKPWPVVPVLVLPTKARFGAGSRIVRPGGGLLVWLPSEVTHLQIIATGAYSPAIAWTAGTQVVQLRAANTYRFALTGLDAVPPEVAIDLSFFTPAGRSPDPVDSIRARSIDGASNVRDGMILERPIALPGRVDVSLRLRSKLDGNLAVALPPIALDIPAEPSAEPLRVEPAAGAVESALAELRRREQR